MPKHLRLWVAIALLPTYCFSQSKAVESLQAFGVEYGVEISIQREDFDTKAAGYRVIGKAINEEGLESYAKLWLSEFRRYPIDVFKKAKVKKVILCTGLQVNEQIRAAVPAFDLDAMYYDTDLGAKNPSYQRSVVHHEFFHMLDYRSGQMRKDPDWAKLNPSGFKYGDGGSKMRTSGVGNLTKEIPGFITRYGTSAIEEDKAELFAHLMIDPEFMAERVAADPFLLAKSELLKKRLEALGLSELLESKATILNR